MFKKLFLFLTFPVLMFFIVNCRPVVNCQPDGGMIYVNLAVPQSRGLLNVEEYQITEATITLKAPDKISETQTWVPGKDTTLIFENKGSGSYTLAVREKDEMDNEASFEETFAVRYGFNVVLTVYLGGNIFITVDNEDSPVPHQIEWQKCLGGSDSELAYSIQQTADAGYIVGGYTSSNDGDVLGNHGEDDYWIVKLDPVANVQWQTCLGGSEDEKAYSVQQTADDGYIIAGTTASNDGDVSGNHGSSDLWLVKLDGVGNLQWQQTLGGSLYENAYSVKQTVDNGYIVAGTTISNDGDVSGNHGSYDFWLVKLDFLGTIQWQRCLGGTGGEWVISVEQTTDDGYIVSGETTSSDGDVLGYHGGADFWVVKLDSTGALQWQTCLGGSHEEEGSIARQTSDGGYIVVGQTNGDMPDHIGGEDTLVVKLNLAGITEWQRCLGGTNYDTHLDIRQTSDGCFIMVGYAGSDDGDVSGNHGGSDIWVVKMN